MKESANQLPRALEGQAILLSLFWTNDEALEYPRTSASLLLYTFQSPLGPYQPDDAIELICHFCFRSRSSSSTYLPGKSGFARPKLRFLDSFHPPSTMLRTPRRLALRRTLATSAAHVHPTPPPQAAPSLPSISHELRTLKSSLTNLLGSSHPSLDAVAKYYFQAEGKNLRPMIVLLMSQATNGLGGVGWDRMRRKDAEERVDESLTSVEGVLNDWNPDQMGMEGERDMVFAEPYLVGARQNAPRATPSPPPSDETPLILSTQRRLASITEMIHVASLLHDDVIDNSPLRRGSPSAPAQFSNKLSILAGDFLLGRASVALARLGSREVVELLATVLANLVEGEVMQMRANPSSTTAASPSAEAFEIYMRKTYLKTASLMAKSARASVILGGCGAHEEDADLARRMSAREMADGERIKDIAYAYGRNLGIAFQVRSPPPPLPPSPPPITLPN